MIGLFKQLLDFFKFDSVWIDNSVFRLHYKATVIVFVTASLLVTSRQYIGDPIDCMSEVPGDVMDTYCWIHSTFSIPSRWVGIQGKEIPHAGVAPIDDLEEGQEKKYHKYYQWVCFFLFLQAAMFYIPRYIWKSSEGGKIKMLVQGLQEPMLKPEERSDQISIVVKYFRLHRGTHGLYAIRFFFCELLNFVNIIGQIYFLDFFLDYEFSTYGMDVLKYQGMEPEDRPDPMAKVFPKVTKCTFFKYGPSGGFVKSDGLCVLPLNIINEKIFVFIYFWLIAIAAITGVFLIYRLAVIAGAQIRIALITVKGGKSVKKPDVEAILDYADPRTDKKLNFVEQLGDWFVLHLICKNIHELVVNDLIKALFNDTLGDNSNTETMKLKPESSAV